jgi:hypothetical protein
MVGELTSSTRVLGTTPLPVRTLEGKICSKPASLATFSILLKYCKDVSSVGVGKTHWDVATG